MIDVEYMSNVNLATFAEVKYPGFEKDYKQLNRVLNLLRATESEQLPSCYIRTLFLISCDDIRVISKELERAANTTTDDELKVSLSESLQAYADLLNRCETLEQEFAPYLFCPAKEEPQ